MGFISLADVIANLVASVVAAVGGLLCAPLCEKIKSTIDVINASESLDADVEKLSDMVNEIKGMRSSDDIDKWLLEVTKIMEEIPQVLVNPDGSLSQDNGQSSCCFFSHGVLRCKLQKKVRKLTVRGQKITRFAKLKLETVELIHGVPRLEEDTTAEKNLNQVMAMLNYPHVWSIGVWGPGGVGKTTLVNILNNKLKDTSSFSLVILIPLIKDANEEDIQKAIIHRLDLKVKESTNTKSITDWIRNRLQKEKFLLILDNVWKFIDLPIIGIPERQEGSKIILTTRFENVCTRINARSVKIGYLKETEAWRLFREQAGGCVDREVIRPLAEAVCRECGGLPLAIVAAGSAMRGKTNIELWQNAVNDLQSSIPIDVIESQVYKPLKLSYDSLEDDTLRSCFLYCSLYPENYYIELSELVQCWLAEKFIDEQLHYENIYSKGFYLIEKLKESCLLEKAAPMYGEIIDAVKMHDVVRDAARWIAKSIGTSVVFSGHGISRCPVVTFPEEAKDLEWISLVDNNEIALPEHKMDLPKVTTLLIGRTNCDEKVKVSREFIEGFRALRVLNMWQLQSFPSPLLCLEELRVLLLRECGDVEEVPLGVKLKVLNLSDSSVRRLPRGTKQLVNLKVLNLMFTTDLKSIDADTICNLKFLEILDMWMSGYKWPTKKKSNVGEATLQDLSGLKWLKEVYLELADVEGTYEECIWMERLTSFVLYYGLLPSTFKTRREEKRISVAGRNVREIRSFILHADTLSLIRIQNIDQVFVSFSSVNQLKSKLRVLNLARCSFSKELAQAAPECNVLSNLENLWLYCINDEHVTSFSQIMNALGRKFPKLRTLSIIDFWRLEDVFSSDDLHMVLPKLDYIFVSGCGNMTEVFQYSLRKIQATAPKLQNLVLSNLHSLQRLCHYELNEQWRSLQRLEVKKCPKLKKLPYITSTIRGSLEWWDKLEWDNAETKSSMEAMFLEIYEYRGKDEDEDENEDDDKNWIPKDSEDLVFDRVLSPSRI